jgi:hypothetical protein
MSDSYIVLTKARGKLKEGRKVRVLGPTDQIEGVCVDAAKAETLVRLGLAESHGAAKRVAEREPEPEPVVAPVPVVEAVEPAFEPAETAEEVEIDIQLEETLRGDAWPS